MPHRALDRWPSGLRRTLGKRVYVNSVPRVRIPVCPPPSFQNHPRFRNRLRASPPVALDKAFAIAHNQSVTDTIPLISLVVPCYNESEAIAPFAATIIPLLEAIPETQWEIICVDDGSKDDTLAQLIALSQRDPRFKLLELSRNFGKEAAMTAGLDAARGDAVIPFDADMQDPPELIPEMLAAWREGAEMVLALSLIHISEPTRPY